MFSGLLIGNQIRITDSRVPSLGGLSGKIIDETKNTFVVEKAGSRKKLIVPKLVVCFETIDASGRPRNFAGKDLIATPQERINKS